MRIAFAGLATSHPFALARLATRARDLELSVWDSHQSSVRRFASEFPARRHSSARSLLSDSPDVVIVSVRPQHSAVVVGSVLESGAACYHSKVASANLDQLEALDRVVSPQPERYLGGSVLRFAPALQTLGPARGAARLDVLVKHDIGFFLDATRAWQDDPAEGGGTAISLGVHGWEIASAILGEPFTAQGGTTSLDYHASRSEDGASLRAISRSGTLVEVTIVGAADSEEYRAEIHTEDGSQAVVLGGGDEDVSLGYEATTEAILALGDGAPSPVDWALARNVIETGIVTAQLARPRL